MVVNLPETDREESLLPEQKLPTEGRPSLELEKTTELAETEKNKNEKIDSNKLETKSKLGIPKIRRAPTSIPSARDPITIKVEKIMEEGLNEAYSRLSPIAQQEFKLKGEETAYKITELLKSAHVQVKKIFRLLLDWLKMLPGVNRFFLEQEAKIKTDKIIMLNNKEHGK